MFFVLIDVLIYSAAQLQLTVFNKLIYLLTYLLTTITSLLMVLGWHTGTLSGIISHARITERGLFGRKFVLPRPRAFGLGLGLGLEALWPRP